MRSKDCYRFNQGHFVLHAKESEVGKDDDENNQSGFTYVMTDACEVIV